MGLLYTKFKIFHFKEKIDSLPREVKEVQAPIHVRIKPTNVCGHHCWYCSYRAKHLQIGKDMNIKDYVPREKMLEIIDDIITMGVKAVTFSGGGDPFYYPYLLDAVRKLSGSPVQFSALHNGARLTGEIADIFAHHATWLRISIDGWDAESYAEYRGVAKEEFEKVINNMARFKQLKGACFLGVSLIIDKKNFSHIFEFSRKLKDIGVDSIRMSACVVSDDPEENNRYHKDIFEEAKRQIQKVKDCLSDNSLEVYDAYHELSQRFEKEYSWCPSLQIVPVIGADSNVYACHDKAYNLNTGLSGSLKNQRFKEFWFSEKNNFFKINPSVVCNHHCMANETNKMILQYLGVDKGHGMFV